MRKNNDRFLVFKNHMQSCMVCSKPVSCNVVMKEYENIPDTFFILCVCVCVGGGGGGGGVICPR